MKLNTPNKLIIVRLVLAFMVVVLTIFSIRDPSVGVIWSDDKLNIQINYLFLISGFLFALASITDWLDGYLARKNNQITDFGKLFDPLADKILVNSVLVMFSVAGIIPIAVTIIFICRDILVDGLRMMLSSKGIILAAHKLGKLKTIFQMIWLMLLFVIQPICEFAILPQILLIPIYIAMVFSVWSGIDYFIKGFKSINEQ